MDSAKPSLVGTPAMQGPVQPGATPLPGATSGLFGSGGEFSLATTMKATSALATGFGGFMSYKSGAQASTQFEMQAQSYETRAEIVKLNAIEKSNLLRKQLLSDLGSANASAAARGIDSASVSQIAIRTESIGAAGRDIQKLKSGAIVEASGEYTSAARSRIQGSEARLASYIRTTGGLGKYALSQVL